MRSSRILVAGEAKSGTTAMFFKIKNSLPKDTKCLFEPQEYHEANEHKKDIVLAKILLGSRDIRYDQFDIFETQIMTVRDPRDRIVSQVLYYVLGTDIYKSDDKLYSLLELLKIKEKEPRNVSLIEIRRLLGILNNEKFSALGWRKALQQHLERVLEYYDVRPNLFVNKYEALINNDVSDLENYLRIKLAKETTVDDSLSHVARRKKSGDWRNWFVEEDVNLFRDVFSPYMNKFGYDDDWEISETPVVHPEHCSQYVEKISVLFRNTNQ